MKVFQIGSSIDEPETANDLDLVVICDKPVDVCIYTSEQWEKFKAQGTSNAGHRVVIYPPKHKGDKVKEWKQLL